MPEETCFMKVKILVVDDEEDMEPMILQRFRYQVQKGNYQFSFALSVRQALAIIKNEPDLDVLLLDINMPEISGLTLLTQLPELLPYGKAVIVSAYNDMDNIRTAMNRGAFDFVCKPINFEDLESTIEKTAFHVQHLRESAHIKAVADLKTRFYDNITHDFRTPLTLILASLERLTPEQNDKSDFPRHLLTIERNAHHLLRLINQLLELAKLEAGHLVVTTETGNLGKFVGELVQAFYPLANYQNIQISYENNLTGYWIYDQEKVGQIVYNLIANAIKFTSVVPKTEEKAKVGQIIIRLDAQDEVVLSIHDTGIGIPEAHLPYIFNRFYQVDSHAPNGSGIGLSLVNELTELMGGSIYVESATGTGNAASGTTFRVTFPFEKIGDAGIIPDKTIDFNEWFPNPVSTPVFSHSFTNSTSEAPLLLLVEDNLELLSFMAEKLSLTYRVITASDGEQGWQLAHSELPDIIISDVMIPYRDGFELTQLIKTTPATDHIAVILLTSKASHDNRLTGLRKGADDYLTKPFYFEELSLRVHNLTTRQQKLRTFYNQHLTQPELPQPIETVQNEWLHTLYNFIEKHLDNPAMNVEWLAGQIGMSRKTLLRKVQSLTQLSPNELIRQYRLRKSISFLKSGHNVSETAYLVGFETPAYFGQCFKEMYHVTPSEFLSSVNSHNTAV